MKQRVSVLVDERFENLTIKELLKYFHVGRGTIEKIRVNKWCLINNVVSNNLEVKLQKGNTVTFLFEEEINIKPYEYELDILYEDDNYLIVNKPAFMLVHSDGNDFKTLTNAVYNYYIKTNQQALPYAGHRLDYETSGIIVFIKNFLCQTMLDYEFSLHKITRIYTAIVEGKIIKKEGTITYKIGKDRHDSKKYRVSSSGVDAITHYKIIKSNENYSLVSLRLETGRTHQIRIHMSYIGHPILGDKLYGRQNRRVSRLCLHSSYLKMFDHINNKFIEVESDLPNEMKRVIK
ncbi:MAG: RluA family pseudouridine synthase [Bacilli bacterium]